MSAAMTDKMKRDEAVRIAHDELAALEDKLRALVPEIEALYRENTVLKQRLARYEGQR